MEGISGRGWIWGAVAASLLALLLAATPADAAGEQLKVAAHGKRGGHAKLLRATIRRTKYGVPHIRAHDVESLAAGYAYAFAEDNIFTIASEYITVAGKRSRFFGPDEEWHFSGNGSTYRNFDGARGAYRIEARTRQLVFLTGPMQGARAQQEAAKHFHYLNDDGLGTGNHCAHNPARDPNGRW